MITKSNYVMFVGCNRCYYYYINNRDKAKETDDQAKKRIDEGNLMNQFASTIFENTVVIRNVNDKPDIALQVKKTKEALKEANAIAEASFVYEDLFCAVDILHNNKDGTYDIYEVKASTDLDKHLVDYYPDVAFQLYVLTKNNIKIKNCFILYLNKEYVRDGEIEVNKLLTKYNLSYDESFQASYKQVEDNLGHLRHQLEINQLPGYGCCGKDCEFFAYCHANLPKPSIIDLNGMRVSKAHKLIDDGIVTYQQVLDSKIKLNNRQHVQLKVCLDPSKKPSISKEALKVYLNKLKYPIYHLDFETMNEAVPPFDGTSPYQQIPFQYSLHIEHSPNGKLEHKEFLADKLDNEYELAKQLCNDIPLNVTSMAYNMSFEKAVIRHLAKRFPEFKDHLMNIHDHLVDLIVPFKESYYYDAKQGGSNSIKYVMPALVPEMENAYHELPLVHNGGEALSMFPIMLKTQGAERTEKRDGMLKYCCLDTLSMVKVLNKLWEMVK